MSRSVNALTALGFGYARYAVAIVSGFFVLPLALARIDGQTYSQWLVAVEILSYLGFVELGIGALLPWVVAECDGRKDREALRRLLADARGCCIVSCTTYLAAFAGMWWFAPALVGMGAGSAPLLGYGIWLVVGCTVVAFFGRMHSSVLEGLQDYVFLGTLMLIQSGISVAAVIALLLWGAGPVALAAGMTIPLLLGTVVSTWRLTRYGSDLVWNLPRPSYAGMARLARDAGGTWMSGIGNRLTMSSNALLISAARGTPDDVIRFVCTTKLGDMLMMQSWQIIDSGLIGLVQLHGEGRRARASQIASVMTRLTLIGAGMAGIVMLGFNPAFVSLWLGAEKFGGLGLNAANAVTLLGLSLVHVFSVTSSALGHRVGVGTISLIHGLAYGGLAIGLGYLLGPLGVAIAGGAVSMLVALPLLSRLQSITVGQTLWDVVQVAVRVWLPRAVVPLALATGLGMSQFGKDWMVCAPATAGLALGYAWLMRPLMIDVPLPRRMHYWTRRLRLIPGAAS